MRDEDILAEMERRFGGDNSEQYVRLAKATRSLVLLWAAYAETPDGSPIERLMEGRLEQMLGGLKTRPEHAIGMIESLLAVIHHMRSGGTYEGWFESIGISPTPGGD